MLAGAALLAWFVTIVLLVRIGWRDFEAQKIANRDVLALAALGLTGQLSAASATGMWSSLAIGLAAACLLFLVLFPFWILKKIGAGDVKLAAAAPLVSGGDYLFMFALLLLGFALLTALLVKNPLLLPASVFRRYLEVFDRKGVVPFGVPISASLVGVTLLQMVSVPAVAGILQIGVE